MIMLFNRRRRRRAEGRIYNVYIIYYVPVIYIYDLMKLISLCYSYVLCAFAA